MGMFGQPAYDQFGLPDWRHLGTQAPQSPFAVPDTPQIAPMLSAPQGMMARPKKPGFGEPGGWGERLGAIGSVLLNSAGVRDDGYDQYQQVRELRREEQRKAQLAEAARYAPQHIGDNIVAMQPDGSFKTLYAGPEKPYRWESNDGSLMEMGEDGQPRVAYKDPTPKINWIAADDGRGGKSLIPVGPNGPLTAGVPTSGPAPGTIDGGYRFKGGNAADPNSWEPVSGGAAPRGPATFR